MGSSAKKRKEKKKDFQKTQFKVGKARAKPDSATDTSFKARSLVLNHQSISVAAPSAASQFSHHVSMLKSRSDSQRQESLAYLTSTLAGWPTGESLPEPPSTFLPKLQPLALDPSHGVRLQLLKLLRTIPRRDIRLQAAQLLLYTRAAMTHLSADVKLFAMDLMEWLVAEAGPEVASCAGGWVKTIEAFVGLLGWDQGQSSQSKGWTSGYQAGGRPGAGGKLMSRQITGLALFIAAGIVPSRRGSTRAISIAFPLWNLSQHDLPVRTDPFANLGLFGSSKENEDDQIMEDREDRQRVLVERFEAGIELGLNQTLKEGGEVGRASAALKKAVFEGLKDFDRDGATFARI